MSTRITKRHLASLASALALAGCGTMTITQNVTLQVAVMQTQATRSPAVASAQPASAPEPARPVSEPASARGGPAFRWNFESVSAKTTWDVIGQVRAKLGGAASLVQENGCGGQGLELTGQPGSDATMDGNVGQFGTHDFTVSVWVNTRSTHYNAEVVSNRVDGSHGNFFNIRYVYQTHRTGVFALELDENSVGTHYVALESPGGYNDGRWHHVVARRAGHDVSLTIDGERVAHGVYPFTTDVRNGEPLHLGSSRVALTYNVFFDGTLDELQVYDRALGDGEIESMPTSFEGSSPRCEN